MTGQSQIALLLMTMALHADVPVVLTVRPASYTVGENMLAVAISNHLDAEQRGSIVITGTGPEGVRIDGKRWLVMPPKTRSSCSVEVELPSAGRYELTIGLYQGRKQPAASVHATIEIPAVRFTPADARIRWICHDREGEILMTVVHDCAYKSEEITFHTPARVFTDRFDGYEVKTYHWAKGATR